MAIEQFTGEHRFLSNFYLCPVTVGGTTYPSAEHAFQASKTREFHLRQRVAALSSPRDAKRFGRSLVLREDWQQARKPVMLVVVLSKFTQNPLLGAKLADTADMEDPLLVEGNTWHDNFWGRCACAGCAAEPGLNYLGRTLMAMRDAVRCD